MVWVYVLVVSGGVGKPQGLGGLAWAAIAGGVALVALGEVENGGVGIARRWQFAICDLPI